jgi:hypothetical protein
MLEIIKTLLVSLSFAATGAGIAWSVTSNASESIASLTIESGFHQAAKGDRLDVPSTKVDRLPMVAGSHGEGAVTVVNQAGQASSVIFRAPLVVANVH